MKVIAAIFLFLAFGAECGEIEDPYVKDCGIYRAIGRLDCEKRSCQFAVFPGSQAEKKFEVKRLSENYIPFNHQPLQTRFALKKGSAPFVVEFMDPFPKIAPIAGENGELLLEKKIKCEK